MLVIRLSFSGFAVTSIFDRRRTRERSTSMSEHNGGYSNRQLSVPADQKPGSGSDGRSSETPKSEQPAGDHIAISKQDFIALIQWRVIVRVVLAVLLAHAIIGGVSTYLLFGDDALFSYFKEQARGRMLNGDYDEDIREALHNVDAVDPSGHLRRKMVDAISKVWISQLEEDDNFDALASEAVVAVLQSEQGALEKIFSDLASLLQAARSQDRNRGGDSMVVFSLALREQDIPDDLRPFVSSEVEPRFGKVAIQECVPKAGFSYYSLALAPTEPDQSSREITAFLRKYASDRGHGDLSNALSVSLNVPAENEFFQCI